MTFSRPIDGDQGLEDIFVQFLGTPRTYLDCCARAALVDGLDGRGLSASDRLAIWVYTTQFSAWYQQINAELWGEIPRLPFPSLHES